jgi:hypothetical protein
MARRLCADHQIGVAEIWSFHAIGDQIRFTMMHRAPSATARRAAAARRRKAPVRPAAKRPAARRAAAPRAKPRGPAGVQRRK